MKLTFDEKKLLYAYGNPDLALTRKRLYEVAGLTVDPDLNRLVFDFVRAEMECYAGMQKLAQDIENDEDWGPEMFKEDEDDERTDAV